MLLISCLSHVKFIIPVGIHYCYCTSLFSVKIIFSCFRVLNVIFRFTFVNNFVIFLFVFYTCGSNIHKSQKLQPYIKINRYVDGNSDEIPTFFKKTFLCLGCSCGARHFNSHWNQLFLLVLCCLMNFLKISQHL